MFGGVAQQVPFSGACERFFFHFGDLEDAPEARGDLRTSMEPPANFASGLHSATTYDKSNAHELESAR